MISGVKDKRNTAQKGTKKKMVLAKDPKEAAAAVIVLLAFFGLTINNIVNYYKSQSAVYTPTAEEASMAKKQQEDLQSLAGTESKSRMEPGVPPNATQPGVTPPLSQDANDIYNQTLKLQGQNPQTAARPSSEDDIEIVSSKNAKRFSGKRITITVAGSGRSNPFLPAGENFMASSLPKFTILPPPEQLQENSDAGNVIGTTISGILYDKYSPSAIINIGGTDYLVKSGDTVDRYSILNIARDQVIVQLGKNVYKARVGQLITQGQLVSSVSNLNKKFGGNEVSINVKKKGY